MTRTVRFDDFAEFERIAAAGFTEWGPAQELTENQAARFAALTGAKSSDGIVSGWMLQAMVPSLIPVRDWSVGGHSGAVNLGSPQLRFPGPARIGGRIRGRSRLAEARPHPRGALLVLEFEAQEEGAEQPCLQSSAEVLYLGGKP